MLLFYTHTITPRLQYICDFIFTEMLQVVYEFTSDEEQYKNHNSTKINYTAAPHAGGFHISPFGLLFENDIAPQQIACFDFNGSKAFFKTEGSHFPFDIFSAIFYLLSRYEEYLPHSKDMYGRFAHENSLAFKESFLQIPLVNKWIILFAKMLQAEYPAFSYKLPEPTFQPTYDIDIAYSYKYKGFARMVGGFLKQPSLQRIKVLLGLEKDPFDTYVWLDQLHATHHLAPIYFFLMAAKNGLYDKNILPASPAIQNLIRHHANKYSLGIHPSWQSGDDESLLLVEKKQLETISNKQITCSRQHYIRFNLPAGYERLVAAGIADDFSMGYGSINGFRASVANSFLWYNLQQETTTALRIHPFCFMEANAFYEQHFTPAQAAEELLQLYAACRQNHGCFISIWHNQFFGTDPLFKGWRQVYENFISAIK